MPLIIEFVSRYWRVILIGLIVSIAFGYKMAYKSAVQELALLKADIAQLAKVQQAKNDIIEANSKIMIASILEKHASATKHLNRDKLIKDLQDDKTLNSFRIAALRDGLQLASSNRSSMPEVSITAEGTTEEWRNSYRTVVEACQLTTLDYNALWDSWSSACKVHGCK